jgi:hypothetical protein
MPKTHLHHLIPTHMVGTRRHNIRSFGSLGSLGSLGYSDHKPREIEVLFRGKLSVALIQELQDFCAHSELPTTLELRHCNGTVYCGVSTPAPDSFAKWMRRRGINTGYEHVEKYPFLLQDPAPTSSLTTSRWPS